MITLWRISNYAELSGISGKIGNARWHLNGRPIVYLAGSPAEAMLERLVHLFDDEGGALPRFYELLRIEGPDSIGITALDPASHEDWRERPQLTRSLGSAWLASGESPLAIVPSAIVPHTWNFLLNPKHPDAGKLKIVSATRERFNDRRFEAMARPASLTMTSAR